MGVKIGVILTLLLILEIENRVYAQMSEHLNLQQQNLPTEACDSMTVSYSGASRGKREFKLIRESDKYRSRDRGSGKEI